MIAAGSSTRIATTQNHFSDFHFAFKKNRKEGRKEGRKKGREETKLMYSRLALESLCI